MRRFTKNTSLYDLAPDLVKEWHPSANGNLTPKRVTIIHSKKVWWICSESHEWRATIKSRINGQSCPFCAGGPVKKTFFDGEDTRISPKPPDHVKTKPPTPSRIFEIDPVDDDLGHNFRKSRRYKMKATAVLENPLSGHLIYADVKNVSAGGMCFETDACFSPGTKVTIKLDRPLFISDQKKYDSIIRWCKVFDNDNDAFAPQCMGAEFI